MSTTTAIAWEYQTIYLPHGRLHADKLHRKDLEQALQEAGDAGWEAFSFFPNVNIAGERDGALILCKRPAH